MACDITAGALFDCDDLPQAGVASRLVIGNLADIVFTIDGSNNSLVTAFVKSSVAYAFEGSDMSVKPMYTLAAGSIVNQFIHKIEFVIFDVSSTQKQNLELMKNAKLFVITEQYEDSGNGDNFYEVYGIGRGLRMAEMERIVTDNESLGAFKITLETFSDGGNESHMPPTFFKTNFAATKVLVDSLTTQQA